MEGRNARKVMKKADFALVTASVISAELAFLGKPMLLVCTAANQEQIAREMRRQGTAIYLGRYSEAAEEMIRGIIEFAPDHLKAYRQMGEKARRLFDGRGAERIAQEIIKRMRSK